MALQVVYSGNLDPSDPNLSVEFSNATAFLIQAPGLNAELEIDCFLQLYVTGLTGEIVRNIPLGRIEEQAILLNISDTETVQSIPAEYLNSGLQMRLLFLASEATFLYAYIIKPDCTLCDLSAQNIDISLRLDRIEQALTNPALDFADAAVNNGNTNLGFLL